MRISDLPPDKRTKAFGRALGDWLGETVKVDVDKDGVARGQNFRIRTKISVFEPLIRGIYLRKKKDNEEKTWFDFYYDKIPHFCFDCGRLVHKGGECDPPVDAPSQWGAGFERPQGGTMGAKMGQKLEVWEARTAMGALTRVRRLITTPCTRGSGIYLQKEIYKRNFHAPRMVALVTVQCMQQRKYPAQTKLERSST